MEGGLIAPLDDDREEDTLSFTSMVIRNTTTTTTTDDDDDIEFDFGNTNDDDLACSSPSPADLLFSNGHLLPHSFPITSYSSYSRSSNSRSSTSSGSGTSRSSSANGRGAHATERVGSRAPARAGYRVGAVDPAWEFLSGSGKGGRRRRSRGDGEAERKMKAAAKMGGGGGGGGGLFGSFVSACKACHALEPSKVVDEQGGRRRKSKVGVSVCTDHSTWKFTHGHLNKSRIRVDQAPNVEHTRGQSSQWADFLRFKMAEEIKSCLSLNQEYQQDINALAFGSVSQTRLTALGKRADPIPSDLTQTEYESLTEYELLKRVIDEFHHHNIDSSSPSMGDDGDSSSREILEMGRLGGRLGPRRLRPEQCG
ncbi:hypothetical protein QJS10_CPA09g01179 [Acorus calamus]|uniref:Uncharacterized protein n=1 Tax=Acorus calamus TaxID=4465 RepID=A0AAV9E8K8_ACOCL|nr:hypothetical protein QJS10_CPA09g01179 [Acorus calamus]